MKNDSVIRGFGILNRTFVSFISKALAGKELSYSDSIFLVNIGDHEGTTQEELAQFLAIDKAAIARSVKNMEAKGYVRTERHPIDKRAKQLYITVSGKELYQYMQDLNRQWIDQVMGGLPPDDVKTFNRIVDHISNRAKEFIQAPALEQQEQ
ncbi:Multidrug resistance operon repressor [compost metagenome]